jgi:hypothetical protein
MRRLLVQFIIFVCLMPAPLFARAQQFAAPEYQLKAAFLFNFVQFVEWPAAAFEADTSPVVIAVLGEDPFGEHLDQLVQGEKIRGRAIVVQRYASADEVKHCHLLYVNERDAAKLKAILAQLAQRPILTVSDVPEFSSNGGMIHFVTQDNRLRLLINVDAAAAARLTLSSKLLRPAQIVTTAGP